MEWIKTFEVWGSERTDNSFALQFICDSPINSWGVSCSSTSTERFTIESFEEGFQLARDSGWSLEEEIIPAESGKEVGFALCPHCSEIYHF